MRAAGVLTGHASCAKPTDLRLIIPFSLRNSFLDGKGPCCSPKAIGTALEAHANSSLGLTAAAHDDHDVSLHLELPPQYRISPSALPKLIFVFVTSGALSPGSTSRSVPFASVATHLSPPRFFKPQAFGSVGWRTTSATG
jgi:hypothetical protein